MSMTPIETSMPNSVTQPRVRLLLLMIPDHLLHGMDIASMPSEETPHVSIPIRMQANYPILPRIASIGTGCPPLKHGAHTRLTFDETTRSLRPRGSGDIGSPWIWDIVQRSGRSATTIDCPLVPDTEDSPCLSILTSGGSELDESTSGKLLETLERHQDEHLLTLVLNLHLRNKDASKKLDSNAARQVVETIIGQLEPGDPDDHLIVYITSRNFDHMLLFGSRAGNVTKKFALQSDLVATTLDLLDIERTVNIPGQSLLETIDDDKGVPQWPTLESTECSEESIEPAIELVLEGGDGANDYVLNWLTSSWICNSRYRGITFAELRSAQLLNDLRGNAQDIFRLAMSADALNELDVFNDARERLRAEHPESIQDTMAGTMAAAEPTNEQLRSAVNGTDPTSMLPAVARTWCSAAFRAGMRKECFEHLEPLLSHGEVIPADRVVMATHYMDDKSPWKALHALGALGSNPAAQSNLSVMRARILVKCDLFEAARTLLEAVLESSPTDTDAQNLLEDIETRIED